MLIRDSVPYLGSVLCSLRSSYNSLNWHSWVAIIRSEELASHSENKAMTGVLLPPAMNYPDNSVSSP
jgi:hypothetical protein